MVHIPDFCPGFFFDTILIYRWKCPAFEKILSQTIPANLV